MKIVDSKWKLFGKVHVFDVLFILVALLVVVGFLNKASGGNIASLTGGTKPVVMECTVLTYEYDPLYFTGLKVGAQLAEDKSFFKGSEIVSIDLQEFNVSLINDEGQMITGPHPFKKKATVKVRFTADYKEPIYKLGKQEIRVGAPFFITTETCKISAIVIDMKPIKE